jgi:glycine/D-amino acid oxidase-like deaminating enzyme
MQRVSTIIIGGGQAGLAMSACLSSRGVSHAILERKRIAERWRSERWDSLRLLTPNWMNRLPGWSYEGGDPDGFMAAPDVAAMLEDYARHIAAPVHTGTNVISLENTSAGYRVSTNRGEWLAGAVVIATGHCDSPHVPASLAVCRRRSGRFMPRSTGIPARCPKGAFWSWVHRHPASRSRMSLPAADGTSRWQSGGISACHDDTAAATSCGGSRHRASWASSMLKFPTSGAPGSSHRCNCRAGTT